MCHLLICSLLGHTVDLGCSPYGSYFLQSFLGHWGQSAILNLLLEDILNPLHLGRLVQSKSGSRLVQAVIKTRHDLVTLSGLVQWVTRSVAVFPHVA